jgi:integrase/recombinase XerD
MADTKRKRPAEVLTDAEVRSHLAALLPPGPTGIRDRALLTVLYRAGLRIEEGLDLKPGDVDPARGTIRVLHGKGDNDRTVAVDDGAIAVIQLWLAERATLGVNGRFRPACRA